MEIALKIDVDTHQGLKLGVPRLARMLQQEKVEASFYVSMGPDNSGKAIRRVLMHRGFLKKMFRTRAVSMYGVRTVLSGTLLPPRPIALAFPGIMRDLHHRGFEVGVHGYDHVRWQDLIDRLSERELEVELRDAFETYRAIFLNAATSFAAPGWRINNTALKLLDTFNLAYQSNTRGSQPFRCKIAGKVLNTIEIPTTLPTLDEVMGSEELRDDQAIVDFYLRQMKSSQLNVHTIHAETEGMGQLDLFTRQVQALKERGASFVKLETVAGRCRVAELPVCEVVRGELPGRAGWIATQGPNLAASGAPTATL